MSLKTICVDNLAVRGHLERVSTARDRLSDFFLANKIKVAVDSTEFRSIESIAAAVEHLLSGNNCGKVVVRF